MKVHDEIETLTDVYLAGGLEADERRDVEEHAATCDACAAVLRDAKEFHGWVSGSSAPGAPPTGLEDRIIANLRAATPGARRWPKAPRLIKFLGGVAALFVFIIIGGMFTESGRASEIQYKLGAISGVEDRGKWDPVEQSRGPAGGYDIGGVGFTDIDKSYKEELQRNISALARAGVGTDELAGVGGGGGARGRYGGRAGDSKAGKDAALKNLAEDKAPAPASAAPMADAG